MTSSYSITFTVDNPTGASLADRHRHAARRARSRASPTRPETARSRSARSPAARCGDPGGPWSGSRVSNRSHGTVRRHAVQPGRHDRDDPDQRGHEHLRAAVRLDLQRGERPGRGRDPDGPRRAVSSTTADDYPGAAFPRTADQRRPLRRRRGPRSSRCPSRAPARWSRSGCSASRCARAAPRPPAIAARTPVGNRSVCPPSSRARARTSAALALLELAARRLAARLVADRAHAAAQRVVGAGELAVELTLGGDPRDLLAHAVERAHVGVHGQPLERLGQPPPRDRVGQRGQHAALLAREAAQLLAEAQQVGLRLVGLARARCRARARRARGLRPRRCLCSISVSESSSWPRPIAPRTSSSTRAISICRSWISASSLLRM